MAKDLTAALAALSEQSAGSTTRTDRSLPDATPVTAIPSRTGSAKPGSSGSGSIASPLVETTYTDREWHADRTVTSSDGILTFKVRPLKKVKFLDSNNSSVVIEYKPPT